jgi:sugar phosphate isomerase/epimerase
MVFGSPNQRSVLEGVSPEQAWTHALETFRQALPVLKRLGVVLCMEPLTTAETNFLTTAAQAADLVRELESPNIRLMLDVKAMSSEPIAPADLIRAHSDLLSHVHANDANMRGPGFGNTDFVPIAQALRDVHYHGWVSVEVFDFKPDPITIARGSMDYLRKAFAN